jgi:flagellar protein FlbB
VAQKVWGRVVVLLLLIIVVAAGGVVWFDYLNVIDAKTVLAPVYRLLKLDARSQPATTEGAPLSIDAERLAVRLEALQLQSLEMDKQQQEISGRRGEIEQMAAELEERQKSLDERERAMNAQNELDAARNRNIDQNARYLNGMPPADAVAIIATMDDQDAIDVFRKLEEIAAAEGTNSIVSYWISLLPDRQRAASLLRKMANQP